MEGPALEPVPVTRPIRELFSRAGLCSLGFILSVQCAGLILSLVYYLFPSLNLTQGAFLALASTLQYIIALPVCALIMLGIPQSAPQKRRVKIRYILAAFAVSVALSQIGAYIGLIASNALQGALGQGIENPLNTQTSNMSTLENLVVLGVVAPLFEELLFRKFLLDRIRTYGDGIAVFVGALLFGLVHCNVYQFFYAFFIGALLGLVYVYSGKVTYTVILHMAFNIFRGVIPTLISSSIETFNIDLITVDVWQMAYLVYNIAIFLLLVTGIVLMFTLRKRVWKHIAEYTEDFGRFVSPALINTGVISAAVFSLILFLLNTVALT